VCKIIARQAIYIQANSSKAVRDATMSSPQTYPQKMWIKETTFTVLRAHKKSRHQPAFLRVQQTTISQ
jgi:hypothetical protein